MEWQALEPTERPAAYERRMKLIAGLVDDAQGHRESGVCTLAPLCPGGEAALKLQSIEDEDAVDVMVSLVAYAVDQRAEIAALTGSLAAATQRAVAAESLLARAEVEAGRARLDADDGWRAYRTELTRHRATLAGGDDGA